MKKVVSIICVILLLSSFGSLAVLAGDNVVIIAEDFGSLWYCSSTYVRVENDSAIDFDKNVQAEKVRMTKRQEASIREIGATVDVENDAYVVLDILYKTGGDNRIAYVKSTRLDEYNAILEGVGYAYTTQIDYKQDDEIVMTQAQLKGGEVSVRDGDEIPHTNTFTVWAESEDGSFSQITGEIKVVGPEGEYYYLDFFQNGKDGYYDLMTNLGACEDVMLYRITDEKLLARIEMDYAAYYDAQMLPYTEDVGKVLSAVMITLIFGALPFAVIVVSVIGWIRSKKRLYRYLFVSMVLVGGAELAAFLTACIMCVINQ